MLEFDKLHCPRPKTARSMAVTYNDFCVPSYIWVIVLRIWPFSLIQP